MVDHPRWPQVGDIEDLGPRHDLGLDDPRAVARDPLTIGREVDAWAVVRAVDRHLGDPEPGDQDLLGCRQAGGVVQRGRLPDERPLPAVLVGDHLLLGGDRAQARPDLAHGRMEVERLDLIGREPALLVGLPVVVAALELLVDLGDRRPVGPLGDGTVLDDLDDTEGLRDRRAQFLASFSQRRGGRVLARRVEGSTGVGPGATGVGASSTLGEQVVVAVRLLVAEQHPGRPVRSPARLAVRAAHPPCRLGHLRGALDELALLLGVAEVADLHRHLGEAQLDSGVTAMVALGDLGAWP